MYKQEIFRNNPQPIIAAGDENLEKITYSNNGQKMSIFCPENNVNTNLFPFDAGPMILGGGVFSRWYLKPQQKEEYSFYLVPKADPQQISLLKELFSNQ